MQGGVAEKVEFMEEKPGHDFTKISYQDWTTCNDCGTKIRFADNPDANREMMEHDCPPGDNPDA